MRTLWETEPPVVVPTMATMNSQIDIPMAPQKRRGRRPSLSIVQKATGVDATLTVARLVYLILEDRSIVHTSTQDDGDDEGIFDTDSLEEGSSKVENEVDTSYTTISTAFHVGNMSKKWYLLNCCITCTEVPINVL